MERATSENERDTAAQYLFDYLDDEFRRLPGVRIRATREDNEPGISVKTEAREYFFPYAWAWRGDFVSVQRLVRQIRDGLESH